MSTSGIHHHPKISIQRDGINSGVCGSIMFIVHKVGYGGKQSGRISQAAERFVKQGGNGRLAVGAGHAHQLQLFRRISEPL